MSLRWSVQSTRGNALYNFRSQAISGKHKKRKGGRAPFRTLPEVNALIWSCIVDSTQKTVFPHTEVYIGNVSCLHTSKEVIGTPRPVEKLGVGGTAVQ